jgi:hypothetical protein
MKSSTSNYIATAGSLNSQDGHSDGASDEKSDEEVAKIEPKEDWSDDDDAYV